MRVTENWRLKDARYQLKGNRSQNNEVNFPPREVKPRDVKPYQFDKHDEAYAWTPEEILAEAH